MTQEELARQVARSRYFAAGLIAVVALSYVLKFYGSGPSNDPASWGQFGDYIGGMLNPVIAYLAFYWLTQSIVLQREELSATKDALRESANAQLKQERHASKTAKINALSTLISSHNSDISSVRGNMEFVTGQLHHGHAVFSPQGHQMPPRQAIELLAEMTRGLEDALARRTRAIEEVTALLREPEV